MMIEERKRWETRLKKQEVVFFDIIYMRASRFFAIAYTLGRNHGVMEN